MKRSALMRHTPMARTSLIAKPHFVSMCTQCDKPFRRRSTTQTVCGRKCAEAKAEGKLTKREAARLKELRETVPKLLAKAQEAFNAWVRLRDAAQPCISCGAPPPDLSGLHAGRDAGHYRSVGAAGHLRFHEDNVHAQCVHCNQHLAGNFVAYRIGLVARIGERRVKALEHDNTPHKWTKDELRLLAAHYRAEARELKSKRT